MGQLKSDIRRLLFIRKSHFTFNKQCNAVGYAKWKTVLNEYLVNEALDLSAHLRSVIRVVIAYLQNQQIM